MNLNTTQDSILLYLYNELNTSERRAVEKAMQSNASLREYYEEQKQLLRSLDECSFEPSETSVQIVMEESHSTNLEMI